MLTARRSHLGDGAFKPVLPHPHLHLLAEVFDDDENSLKFLDRYGSIVVYGAFDENKYFDYNIVDYGVYKIIRSSRCGPQLKTYISGPIAGRNFIYKDYQ